MAVDAEQLGRQDGPAARRDAALEAVAASARAIAGAETLTAALDQVVRSAAAATRSDLVVARLLEPDARRLVVRAVATASRALAAELAGSPITADAAAFEEPEEGAPPPESLRSLCERVGAEEALRVPVSVRGGVHGTLELVRKGAPYTVGDRLLARLAADQVATALWVFEGVSRVGAEAPPDALELAGEALAAGADAGRAAGEIVRLAVEAADARAARLWRLGEDKTALVAAFGSDDGWPAGDLAAPALESERILAADGDGVVRLQLGRPTSHVLEVAFGPDAMPEGTRLARLGAFGVRAIHALRSGERAQALETELDRARALLAAAAQANAELSLSHTLSTTVETVGKLLDAERIAVYLREEHRLVLAAGGPLPGPHTAIAERLLRLALGPFRGRGVLAVADARSEAALAGLEDEIAATGIGAAVAVPLVVSAEVVGLLAVYPPRGRVLSHSDSALLGALAAQTAVAVQNARLHEFATEEQAKSQRALAELRRTESNLRALYEISRSFAQSLSLDETLEAVARTIVDLLAIDAVVLRMPAGRGDEAVAPAVHVADPALEEPVRSLLLGHGGVDRRLLQAGQPLVLDAATAASHDAYRPLAPFLEKGSSAVVLPIATPAEVLGSLTLLSLDPALPITPEATELALSVAAQAALALEKARLYEQEKSFADTMQRSLLPRSRPDLPGIEVGHVYESSARVEVGGDVYDFLALPDGRLAVVLGDVTGHGIDAAADMAMAKFVFRSLAREHPEPGEFLAAANDVVCGEIAPGKFITMLYLTVDGARGEIACASGGHPVPRVVAPDGTVTPLETRGLVLGIEAGQAYEEARAALEPGAAAVLYTDGVIEARRGSEQYGPERLDRLLAERRHLSPDDLAAAVVEDCRAFADGELTDDCAVVVVRRTGG